MIKTVIFDLDGTLVDTIGGIANACNHVLTKFGFRKLPVNAYKALVGNGLTVTMYRALPEEARKGHDLFIETKEKKEPVLTLDPEFISPYQDELLDYYGKHPLVSTKLFKGIDEMLNQLEAKGIRWGIHTNKSKDIALEIAEAFFGQRKYLGLSGPDSKTSRKPSPQGALQLIGENFNADEVLYVGDTEVDIKTARNLGVKVASVTWGFRRKEHLEDECPDYIVNRLEELMDLLR